MSLLGAMKTDNDVQEQDDVIGGGGPLESGLYPVTIELAYLTKAQSGAIALNLNLKTDDGKNVRQNLWVCSGDKKGNKTYYEKDGVKKELPGFAHANAMALMTNNKPLDELNPEKKLVNVYSPEASKEVPTEVEALTELMGKRVIIGLLKKTVDKNEKADDGSYVATGDTRDINEIDKVFHEDTKMTLVEAKGKASEPQFYHRWDAQWTGKTKNEAKGASGNAGSTGAPKAQSNSKPTESLFGQAS